MNCKKISEPDYILSLIPLITFSYPISVIIFASNFPVIYFRKIFDNVIIRDLIAFLFMIFLTLVSVIGWIWKDRKRNQKNFSIKPLLLMLLDIGLFWIIVLLFTSTLVVSFEAANYWNLALGFIFIVIVKFSVDIHNTVAVYDLLIIKFQSSRITSSKRQQRKDFVTNTSKKLSSSEL